MTPRDHLIDSVRRLCAAKGGPDAVADAAGVSAEYLKQILSGVKLPSGQPRGPGPGVQRKLEAKFPGWASPGIEEPRKAYGSAPPSVTRATQQLLLDLDDLPPARASALIDMIHQEAEQARAAAEHILSKRQPAAAAKLSGGRSSRTLKIKVGDGNPGQGVLPLQVVDDPFTAEPEDRERDLYARFESTPRHGC